MKKDELKQPFFVKLLETQRVVEDKANIWPPFTTKKNDDFEQTQKYPSDNDEY